MKNLKLSQIWIAVLVTIFAVQIAGENAAFAGRTGKSDYPVASPTPGGDDDELVKRKDDDKSLKKIEPEESPVPTATDTPMPAATDTPVPAATDTPVPAATDTPTDPAIDPGVNTGTSFFKAPKKPWKWPWENNKKVFNDKDDGGKDNEPSEASLNQAKDCEDEAMTQILLLLKDKNILGKMFELTSMRLAARALEQGETTLEDMVKKEARNYSDELNKMAGTAEVHAKVLNIYEVYGEGKDAITIRDELNEAKEKFKDPCYFCNGESRLYNRSISAYVLSLTYTEEEFSTDAAAITKIDAGMAFIMDKLMNNAAGKGRDYRPGGKYGNLMNLSTRVARHLGEIATGRSLKDSRAKLKGEIEQGEKDIQDFFNAAFNDATVQSTLRDCLGKVLLNSNNESCPECVEDYMSKLNDRFKNVKEIQHSLTVMMAKSSTSKITKGLRGEISGMQFDLSNFAKGFVKKVHNPKGAAPRCGKKHRGHRGSGRHQHGEVPYHPIR